MDMSPACTPPTHDAGTTTERQHPRWPDFERYRSAMARQMVSGASFASWLQSTEEFENGKLVVFSVDPGARLDAGWYVNHFRPLTRDPRTVGPFPDEAAAQAWRP